MSSTSEPQWLTDLHAAVAVAIERIMRGDPPPCDHRYCHRQGYAICMGVAGAQIDMLEDNGWSQREASLKVAADIFQPSRRIET
jgi:hypothetical protein